MEEKERVAKLQKAMDDIHKYKEILKNTEDEIQIKEAIKGIRETCSVLKQIREEAN